MAYWRSGTGGAKVAEGSHEESETDAIAWSPTNPAATAEEKGGGMAPAKKAKASVTGPATKPFSIAISARAGYGATLRSMYRWC